MTTQVEWGDGTGEKIYLSYSASDGDQIITVTSDANTGPSERQKDIIFKAVSKSGTIVKILTVRQDGSSSIFLKTSDGKYVVDANGRHVTVEHVA